MAGSAIVLLFQVSCSNKVFPYDFSSDEINSLLIRQAEIFGNDICLDGFKSANENQECLNDVESAVYWCFDNKPDTWNKRDYDSSRACVKDRMRAQGWRFYR